MLGNRKKERREESEIVNMLRSCSGPQPDACRKRLAINSITAQFGQKPVIRQIPFWQKLARQAGYISRPAWVMQLVLTIAAVWLFRKIEGQGAVAILVAAAAIAPLFGLIGCTELARSFSQGMWEMEDACRYPLKYVMSMRMAVFGILDVLAFAALIACSGRGGDALYATAVFLLVPFHLSNIAYLFLLMKTGGKCTAGMLAAAGVVLSVLSAYGSGRILDGGMLLLPGQSQVFRFAVPGTLESAAPGMLALASFGGMLAMAYLFIKRNQWEVRGAWN